MSATVSEGCEAVAGVWPQAIVQTCVLDRIRNTFRYARRAVWDDLARDRRPVYTATTEQAARLAFDEFAGKWGETDPAIIRLWQNAWAEFVTFLAHSPEMRKVIYSTNAIESLHAHFRRAVRVRDHARWITRWKPALNAFAVTFEGRIEIND